MNEFVQLDLKKYDEFCVYRDMYFAVKNKNEDLKEYILKENILENRIKGCEYTLEQLLDLDDTNTRGIAKVEKLLKLGFTEDELKSAIMEVWSA